MKKERKKKETIWQCSIKKVTLEFKKKTNRVLQRIYLKSIRFCYCATLQNSVLFWLEYRL